MALAVPSLLSPIIEVITRHSIQIYVQFSLVSYNKWVRLTVWGLWCSTVDDAIYICFPKVWYLYLQREHHSDFIDTSSSCQGDIKCRSELTHCFHPVRVWFGIFHWNLKNRIIMNCFMSISFGDKLVSPLSTRVKDLYYYNYIFVSAVFLS